ncbi:MAG: PAS domain S-box protein, partial [Vicinamibacteraceae bacterium]|nr:PAS domain S-box protein [Vicinamibacteraceae bacterium]
SFMNPIAQRLTGWMGESALGQPLESVFVIVNEETRAAVANPARRALRDGTIVGLSNHTVLISRDGTERPIDDSAAPIRNREGEVAGSVLVFRDITERRRGERELRTSEVRFRTMADSIAQLAWIANAEGRFQWFNRRWYDYTGTTPAQMAAPGGWQSVHAPDEWPRVIERWQASIVTGEPFDMVVQIRGADGDYRPFLTRIAPVSDDEGRVVQWFGTKTDVSEVKRAEEALREADRRKDEFLATLAHELRNPLAPIRYALAVMENAGGNVTLLERARLMMERHIAQMVRLIDDLLDVSRISRGKLSLRMERVDLATVMTDAVDTVRPLVEAGGQRLIVAYPTEPMLIMADATRLAQVFANLLNNSAKYTEPDGEIHFGARVSGGFAYVTVRDTGVGIPPEELSRIFEMFSQVDRTVERSQGGLGIGLTLVKRLVEMHGGTISAHSDGDGKGAEFTVALPLPPAPGHVQADAGTQAGAV